MHAYQYFGPKQSATKFTASIDAVHSKHTLPNRCLLPPILAVVVREEEAVNEAELSPEDFQDKKQRMKAMREQVQ